MFKLHQSEFIVSGWLTKGFQLCGGEAARMRGVIVAESLIMNWPAQGHWLKTMANARTWYREAAKDTPSG